MPDLFQILGVSPSAGEAEIKAAFRRLARRYHPDVNSSPDAAERFKQLSEAYHRLSDPRLRELYRSQRWESSEEYLRRQAVQRAVSQKLDAAIDQVLKEQREEEAARQVAVRTVVALFLSTFGVAMLRPPVIESLDLSGRICLFVIFLLGVREIAVNIGFSLERFTYADRLTASLLHAPAPPTQPFSRSSAVGFLVIGYLVCFSAGWMLGDGHGLLGRVVESGTVFLPVLLLPPIAVLIISRLGVLLDSGRFIWSRR